MLEFLFVMCNRDSAAQGKYVEDVSKSGIVLRQCRVCTLSTVAMRQHFGCECGSFLDLKHGSGIPGTAVQWFLPSNSDLGTLNRFEGDLYYYK
jgi:hypothetical protein